MTRRIAICAGLLLLACACSSGTTTSTTSGSGTTGSSTATNGTGSATGGQSCPYLDASYPINCTYDPGFSQTAPNTPDTISVTFSGETLGVDGLPFFPNLPGDPVFVDGWSVQILESLIVVGNIRLDPGATQSSVWQDVGATNTPISSATPVVLRPGPYVLDAHRVSGFLGKDGIEAASGLFLVPGFDNGQAFDTSMLYAFSYDTLQATWGATNINLDPSELPDYALMVQNHWNKLIKGLATHTQNLPAGQGGGTPTEGTYPDTDVEAKFEAMPQQIYFAFGYDDHTHMYNCVNPDNAIDSSSTCSSDPIHCLAARGVQTNSSGTYIAQVTVHQDHVFWDKLEFEGEPLRFDPIAAWAPQNTTLNNPFWINNLTSQKLAAAFSDGTPLPDRGPYMQGPSGYSFVSDQTSPPLIGCNGGCGQDQVIMNVNGVTTVPATDYPDFMEFSVQSQTHLNAQGICYIEGQHSSDPYFTPNVQPVSYGDPQVAAGGNNPGTSGTGGSTGGGTGGTSGTGTAETTG
jgi:hypothetical protein